jgi:hypothetical protein
MNPFRILLWDHETEEIFEQRFTKANMVSWSLPTLHHTHLPKVRDTFKAIQPTAAFIVSIPGLLTYEDL